MKRRITVVNSGLLMDYPLPPIGPLIISASLMKHGYEIDFRDYQGWNYPKRMSFTTFQHFCRDSADILAISAFCTSLPMVLGAVRLIKQEHPEKIIVMGGPGPNDLCRPILENFPVDYILKGEGEESIIELVDAIENGAGFDRINGLAYRVNGAVVENPPRKRIENLSMVPMPAYELVDLKQYDKVASLLTARGCPFRCKFCGANSIWHHKMSYRSIEDIVAEAKIIAEHANVLAIIDDTFTLSFDRAKEIVAALRRAGIDLPISCNGKITLMNKEWLQFFEKNNFIQIFYGVEAGSDRILKKIGKGHTVSQARNMINETANYVSRVRTSYIWGYPFETTDEFYDLIECIYTDATTPGVNNQMSLLSPLPSSALYLEYGDRIVFRADVQSRAGGLPVEEDLTVYPEVIELIEQYPTLFSSFYYYDQDHFEEKLAAIKKVDWIYNEELLNQHRERVFTNPKEATI